MKGSPPRMRGKVMRIKMTGDCGGITPAHAGKSICTFINTPFSRDHPLACGEKCPPEPCMQLCRGSPPRMRGKAGWPEACRDRHGITPAHAGKSCHGQGSRAPCGDHPRACGEKWMIASAPSGFAGSPPRMRGKELYGGDKQTVHGITPAHAGKRRSRLRRCAARWDHPRACGENSFVMVAWWYSVWITPAHAGKR